MLLDLEAHQIRPNIMHCGQEIRDLRTRECVVLVSVIEAVQRMRERCSMDTLEVCDFVGCLYRGK